MAAIDKNTPHADVRTMLSAILADLTVLHAALIATHVKLDADAGITDVNYASTLAPADLTVTAS